MPSAALESPVKNLEFRVQPGHEQTVLHCRGEITLGETSLAFRSAVLELLRQDRTVIVDLSEIHRMDHRGLEMLVSLYSPARIAKAWFKYANLAI